VAIDERDVEREDADLDKHKSDNISNPWRRLFKEKPDRVIELIFAAAIVSFAFLGWRNAQSTTTQTDQLIQAAKIQAYAAQHNAQAASDFSTSARSINDGIGNAVQRLQAQANATEAARESSVQQSNAALQATIDNFHQEQRAWIGLSGFAVIADQKTMGISTDEGINHMNTAIANLLNTGHTPARHVLVLAGIGFMLPDHVLDKNDETWIEGRIRDIETNVVKPNGMWIGHPVYHFSYLPLGNVDIEKIGSGVIPPGIPFPFRPIDNFIGGRFDVVIFGKITYETIDGATPRTTTFCSYRSDTRNSELTMCPIYNDMN